MSSSNLLAPSRSVFCPGCPFPSSEKAWLPSYPNVHPFDYGGCPVTSRILDQQGVCSGSNSGWYDCVFFLNVHIILSIKKTMNTLNTKSEQFGVWKFEQCGACHILVFQYEMQTEVLTL